MKINNECARKILLEIENIPYGETLTIGKLQEKMPEYPIEAVLSIVSDFNKEYFLTILDKASYDNTDVFRYHKIKGLSQKGIKALDYIRSDKMWKRIKDKIENFDDLSIYTIIDIAYKITNVEQNKLLGLPEDILPIKERW